MNRNPYAPPTSLVGDLPVGEIPAGTQVSGPVGLGGWLIVVAIGLVLSQLRLLAFSITTFGRIFRDGTWTLLTTPGSATYHPLWAPLLIFELLSNIGTIAIQLWLLVLYFGKSKRFPRIYVWMALLNLAFILADAWFSSFVLPKRPIIDSGTAQEIVRSIVAVVIWVPYMRVSQRVRNTFVC